MGQLVFLAANSATVVTIPTTAAGTTFAQFPAQPCMALDLVNNTGVDLEYRRYNSGVAMPVLAGTARQVTGIRDASNVWVRRIDQAVTQVNVFGEALNP